MPASAWKTDLCRSEEHTSELQSLTNIVCRLLLEKKKRFRQEVLRRRLRFFLRWCSCRRVVPLLCGTQGRPRTTMTGESTLSCNVLFFFLMMGRPPRSTLFPYPALFR